MDENVTAEMVRDLVTAQSADRFMIRQMLTLALFQLDKPKRLKWVQSVLDASTQTVQFDGIAKGNDLMAANLSEMVIDFQEQVDRTVGQSLALIGVAEEAGAAEFYRKSRSRQPR